jgi:putative oxidoreductase
MQSRNESQTPTPTPRVGPAHKGEGKGGKRAPMGSLSSFQSQTALFPGQYKMHRLIPWGDLAGRLLLAQLFIIEAVLKLSDYPGTVAYMAHYGLPMLLLWPAIALELGGGLLIALGWQIRPVALALAGFCLMTAAIFHANLADRGQFIHFQKDFALAGAFLILCINGAGRLSLDAWHRRRYQ